MVASAWCACLFSMSVLEAGLPHRASLAVLQACGGAGEVARTEAWLGRLLALCSLQVNLFASSVSLSLYICHSLV